MLVCQLSNAMYQTTPRLRALKTSLYYCSWAYGSVNSGQVFLITPELGYESAVNLWGLAGGD